MGLIEFCIEGLERSYLPERRRFSFSYQPGAGRLDSDRRLACKYTLNALLGIRSAERADVTTGFDPRSIYAHTCAELRELSPQPADVAAAVWASGELGVDPAGWVVDRFEKNLSDLRGAHMQDLAWLLLATCVAHRVGEKRWDERAHQLARTMVEEFQHPETGLYFFRRRGARKSFASFAVPVYANLALHEYARIFAEERARTAAIRGIRAMLRLQGPRGQWAWFHDVTTGRVMDWYPIYSVHQDAMAPMVLLRGIELGVEGSREALVSGFRWVLGDNEVDTCMVDPEAKLVFRSLGRRGPLQRPRRLLSSTWKRMAGSSGALAAGAALRIDRQCRSYHLGWMLWTFSGRNDFEDLTRHPLFGEHSTGGPSAHGPPRRTGAGSDG